MGTQIFSLYLDGLGILGTTISLVAVGCILWSYRGSRVRSFRWRWRNWRLMQLSGVTCLFFLAMTASYGVLHEVWAWLYFIAAFKVAMWWFRLTVTRNG